MSHDLPSGTTEAARAGDNRGRPKLLFLCQTLPYPPDSGVHLRSYNILRLLSRYFDVTALCFYRLASRSTKESIDAALKGLQPLACTEAFAIPQEHSWPRLFWDHFRSTAFRRAYTRYAYESAQYRRRIRELLQGKSFDIVHVDSLDLSAYIPMFRGIPVVCTHHNVESVLLRRAASAQSSLVKRLYVDLQSRLTQKEEKEWCAQVDLNVVVSAADLELLRGIAPDARFCVVPSGVDTDVFRPAKGDTKGIVFVGGYGWFPNRDGMLFFLEEILPLIRAAVPDASVTWAGQAPEAARKQLGERYGIHMLGFVDDVRPYVHAAACYVVPLRVGGGTRLKILDAWAMGKAIVSTAVGCEGLDAREGDNILVRDDPRGFAEAVVAVLTDRSLRGRLELGARNTAEKTYDWNGIYDRMIAEYVRILKPVSRTTE